MFNFFGNKKKKTRKSSKPKKTDAEKKAEARDETVK